MKKKIIPSKPRCKQVKFFDTNKNIDYLDCDSNGEELYGWNYTDLNFLQS